VAALTDSSRRLLAVLPALLCTLPVRAEEAAPALPKDAPKLEAPKLEAPKVDAPKLEVPAEAPEGSLPPELGGVLQGGGELQVEELDSDAPLTIEEIVNALVTTASRRAEGTLSAPATLLTLSAADLEDRGYQELSDLLDDLPGMDLARAWGDSYFKTYWRGYRASLGAPWLLLVDGVVFNHLWLNQVEVLAAIPLSNVERVEVVYGPASAVYGPNAAMGVINVITHNPTRTGGRTVARLRLRGYQSSLRYKDLTQVADVSSSWKGDEFRVSLTGRFDQGVLDRGLSRKFEWLDNRYYSDRRLWGDFVDYPQLAGSFRSPSEKQGVDARLAYRGTELAAQLYRLSNGQGVVYAADRIQTSIPYTQFEGSVALKHEADLGERLHSRSLVRYRRSNIDEPTTNLERTSDGLVTFQYWQSSNSSLSAFQDFNLLAGNSLLVDKDELLLDFGMTLEARDLQKGYVISGADNLRDPARPFSEKPAYEWPETLSPEQDLHNRLDVHVLGLYGLAKYSFLDNHALHAGVRVDYDTLLGRVEPTFRGGYVGRFLDSLTVKLLYGQAIQNPTARELFGAWSGTGANPGLKPERSQTFELGLAWKRADVALTGSLWGVHYRDAIISTGTSGQNIGGRLTMGADVGVVALVPLPRVRQLRAWAYYSPYFYAQQTELTGAARKMEDIGDLAFHKVRAGATLDVTRNLGLTVLGRYNSARKTVASNPLGSVPENIVLDANLALRDVLAPGLSIGFKVTNLLDSTWFHPGILEADSGNTPGQWVDERTWAGSSGYFNSWLPQPGRSFSLQVGVAL
jgi:outer membrane receptor protein involved in Fe transport